MFASITNEQLFLIQQDSSKLQTYVLACGLLYGQGEDILHFLFKVIYLVQLDYFNTFSIIAKYIQQYNSNDLQTRVFTFFVASCYGFLQTGHPSFEVQEFSILIAILSSNQLNHCWIRIHLYLINYSPATFINPTCSCIAG